MQTSRVHAPIAGYEPLKALAMPSVHMFAWCACVLCYGYKLPIG